jgi:GntR family transcriptional regulator/MocR family aminotransferase
VAALGASLPDATVRGIAAGLHATVELTGADDEEAIRAEAARRRVAFNTMRDYRPGAPATGPPVLMIGYAQVPESAIPAGVRALAEVVLTARGRP